jgi:pimeloyl-ACP methyl ester carboxylesterase
MHVWLLRKRDLQKVLDTVDARPIVVMGASLGAAVALQAAAEDPRINAIVSVEPFSDLKTVATERAPFFLTSGMIQAAFATAERQGHFSLAAVSPELAAARITVPSCSSTARSTSRRRRTIHDAFSLRCEAQRDS